MVQHGPHGSTEENMSKLKRLNSVGLVQVYNMIIWFNYVQLLGICVLHGRVDTEECFLTVNEVKSRT